MYRSVFRSCREISSKSVNLGLIPEIIGPLPNNFRSEVYNFRAKRSQKLRGILAYFEQFLTSCSLKLEAVVEKLFGDGTNQSLA